MGFAGWKQVYAHQFNEEVRNHKGSLKEYRALWVKIDFESKEAQMFKAGFEACQSLVLKDLEALTKEWKEY